MGTGAITQYIDTAQLVLYAFWIFFFALILYLRKEDKREGYPLESPRSDKKDEVWTLPAPPAQKTFHLSDGSKVDVPRGWGDLRHLAMEPNEPWPGAPMNPTGNPMLDGIGPAAWAERTDLPDILYDGSMRIVPVDRHSNTYDIHVASADIDPRGLPVYGVDGILAGEVRRIWVDRAEMVIRYLETDLTDSGRSVLLPMNFAKVERRHKRIRVKAILAHQFADAPTLRDADVVTLLEEDRLVGYFGGGTLYATPDRMGPLL